MTSPLNAKSAAEFLGVPLRSFYTLDIPRLQYGPRRARWRVEDLEEYMMKCLAAPPRKVAATPPLAGSSINGAKDILNFYLTDAAGCGLKRKRRQGEAAKDVIDSTRKRCRPKWRG